MVNQNIRYDNNEIRIVKIVDMDYDQTWEIPYHKHHYYEFHYICSGSAKTVFKDKTHLLKKGDFYMMSPGLVHAHKIIEGKGHTGFSFGFEVLKGNDQSRFFSLINAMDNHKKHDKGEIYDAILQIQKEVRDKKDVQVVSLSILKLIWMLGEYYYIDEVKVSSLAHRNIVEETLLFMNENIERNLKATQIANAVHVSYTHLSRIFKKELSSSVKKTYQKLKLDKAKEMLHYTDKSIELICEECGFMNVNYFYEFFKKETKLTPEQFRKRNKAYIME